MTASVLVLIHASSTMSQASSFPWDDASDEVAADFGPDTREDAAVSALIEAAATFVTEAPDFDALMQSMAEAVSASAVTGDDKVRTGHNARVVRSDRGTLSIRIWATPASRPAKITVAITFDRPKLPAAIRSRYTRIAVMKAAADLDDERSPSLFADVLLVPSAEALSDSTPVLAGYCLGPSESGDVVLTPSFARGGSAVSASNESAVGYAAGRPTNPPRTDPTPIVEAALRALDRRTERTEGKEK